MNSTVALAPPALPCVPMPVSGGNTYIYLFSLQALRLHYGEAAINDLLAEEVQALQRIKSSQRTTEFLYGRTVLRGLLAACSGVSANRIALPRDAHNKPYASSTVAGKLPNFNLSHAGDTLAIALTHDTEIGLDIEYENSQTLSDLKQIADRHFARAEQAMLAATAHDQLPAQFFRLWTLKEAILKAVGMGLYLPLNSMDLAQQQPQYCVEIVAQGQTRTVLARHWQLPGGRSLALAQVTTMGTVVFVAQSEKAQ